jgi:hypothetical protein
VECIVKKIRRSRWTGERIARLGFLIGLGLDAKSVAADPIISSTDGNVHRQVKRFGLNFRSAKDLLIFHNIPQECINNFDNAAKKRRMTTGELLHEIIKIITIEPYLLDNILDDGV